MIFLPEDFNWPSWKKQNKRFIRAVDSIAIRKTHVRSFRSDRSLRPKARFLRKLPTGSCSARTPPKPPQKGRRVVPLWIYILIFKKWAKNKRKETEKTWKGQEHKGRGRKGKGKGKNTWKKRAMKRITNRMESQWTTTNWKRKGEEGKNMKYMNKLFKVSVFSCVSPCFTQWFSWSMAPRKSVMSRACMHPHPLFGR